MSRPLGIPQLPPESLIVTTADPVLAPRPVGIPQLEQVSVVTTDPVLAPRPLGIPQLQLDTLLLVVTNPP